MPRLEKMLEMAKNMDRRTKIACSVVGSLGVLSAILGFSAEGTKITPDTIVIYGYECIYPQNPALGLGVSAAIFLAAAQVIFSVVGSCCGCCNSRSIPSETKRKIGISCAVASWILAIIAWALLIQGAAWNANVVRMTAPSCSYLKDGVFAGASLLTLAATALGITSLIMLGRQPAEAVAHAGGGYGQAPQMNQNHPQSPPHGAAAQANGAATAPNQQVPLHRYHRPPSAPPKPSEHPPPIGVAPDHQPQVTLPQVQVPNDAPQYPMSPVPASPGGEATPVPMPLTGTPPPPRNQQLSTVIRNEFTRQGIRLAARVMEQALLSDNTATPSIISMMTDSTGGGDVQDTNNYGDAA